MRDKDGWVVRSRSVIGEHRGFSFAKSAKLRGRALLNDVLEAAQRLPLEDSNHPFYKVEQRVQEQLGLAATSPFLVIERVRLLEDRPDSDKKRAGALQRAYLDPARFPPDFLKRHKFEKESLIAIYEKYGYKLTTRDTLLTARLLSPYESNLLVQRYGSDSRDRAVLDAEQRLYALDPKTKEPFVLEFLKASYLEHWKYEIKNRPAAVP
jgi:DNA-binding GntR family transcriptional regulator